jgi:hypothetical protein
MSHWNEEQLPDELREVAMRLRENRPEASGFELDEIKMRTLARARSSRKEGTFVKSRSMAVVLALVLMAGGTGGVIATSGSGGTDTSAAKSQYKPGCGGPNPSGTHTAPPGHCP